MGKGLNVRHSYLTEEEINDLTEIRIEEALRGDVVYIQKYFDSVPRGTMRVTSCNRLSRSFLLSWVNLETGETVPLGASNSKEALIAVAKEVLLKKRGAEREEQEEVESIISSLPLKEKGTISQLFSGKDYCGHISIYEGQLVLHWFNSVDGARIRAKVTYSELVKQLRTVNNWNVVRLF